MGPADSDRISRVPPYSGSQLKSIQLRVRDFHPLWLHFPVYSTSCLLPLRWSFYPVYAETFTVWAAPLSLAATQGITFVFSSSGYLDVSVRRVRLLLSQDAVPSVRRVTPFGYSRI